MRKDLLLTKHWVNRNVDISQAFFLVLVYEWVVQDSLIESLWIVEEFLGVGANDNLAQQLSTWIEEVLEQGLIAHNLR